MKKRFSHPRLPSFGALWFAVALAAGACAPSEKADRPIVLVSVPPQAYFVEQLAGDLVQVEVMIPPGANPATYEPSMAQLRSVARGQLYFKVGHPHFPFESTWLAHLIESNPHLEVIDGSVGLEIGEKDPHVWTSPRNAAVMARTYAKALSELLAQDGGPIRGNLERFEEEIAALDREISELLGEGNERKFLVFHPAWGYFAADYGLVQTAIEEDGKEPDPLALANIIKTAREEGIDVVFIQPQFSHRGAEVIAAEIGAKVIELDPLAPDWAENMRRTARAIGEAVNS